MKVLLSGFCGKMGQVVYNQSKNFADIEITEGFDRKEIIDNFSCNFDGVNLISDLSMSKNCDLVIDFSHFSNVKKILDFCVKNNKPLVLATTGLDSELESEVLKASNNIPIFKSSNMSEGVYVLLNLINKATKMLHGWDIEIVEKHHRDKVDAPSGTGLMMLDEVKAERKDATALIGRNRESGKRNPNEIGMHSIRGGGIVGEHEIEFISDNESIKITHEAFSKGIFADGALKAALFLLNKKAGLYTMKNLFD